MQACNWNLNYTIMNTSCPMTCPAATMFTAKNNVSARTAISILHEGGHIDIALM